MCKFDDVLNCLEEHDRAYPDTYFWFDLVTNNQHKATSLPFEWWCTTFKESIRSIGSVLLIMTPWDNPIPLSRAWCLFEMYSTIEVNAQMNVGIPASQKPNFERAIINSYDSITDVMVALDAEKASASNPHDREQIFSVVRTQVPGGFATLNCTVKERLREWYLKACMKLAIEEESENLLYHLGVTLNKFGHHDDAILVLSKCLKIMLAHRNSDAACAYSALGIAFSDNSIRVTTTKRSSSTRPLFKSL